MACITVTTSPLYACLLEMRSRSVHLRMLSYNYRCTLYASTCQVKYWQLRLVSTMLYSIAVMRKVFESTSLVTSVTSIVHLIGGC